MRPSSRHTRYLSRLIIVAIIASVLGQVTTPGTTRVARSEPAAPPAFAQSEFQKLWARTDQPVTAGAVARSWSWGPAPGVSLMETFVQGVDGKRLVQYFDKARMELNPGVNDPTSPWRVSTGLLVAEMVQGRIQVGEKQFVASTPSVEAVVGDRSSLSYADFASLAAKKSPDRTGAHVTEVVSAGGKVTEGTSLGPRFTRYVADTGHNIPDVFWDYMNEVGLVNDSSGKATIDRLFDWVYVMGYPITEAYWAKVTIAGKEYTVLVQLFQRRALTYVADFPRGWQVQMGNVGQHYYKWRYKGSSTGVPGSPPVGGPTATPTPLFTATGGFVGISGDSFVYAGEKIKLKGTNYWIHSQPFVATWAEWDGPQALAELQKARELGVNTIRIGIPFNHSATSDVVWDDDQSMAKVSGWIVNQLTQLLQIASVHGMKVIFTLFEWYDEYPPEGSRKERTNIAYIEGIVGAFANDDRVLAWDLHNEPDHYGEWQGGKQDQVIKWLQRMTGYVRHLDKRHPVTVGVGDYKSLWHPAADGTTILSFVDVVSFHCYDAGALQKQIEEVKARTSKPILLEEMGWPTDPGVDAPPPGAEFNEETQSLLYRIMLKESRDANIAGVVQWTLWDYRPRSTTGGRVPTYEEHFGLVRTDGTFKPAALIFQNEYTGRILPSETRTYVPLTPAGKKNYQP